MTTNQDNNSTNIQKCFELFVYKFDEPHRLKLKYPFTVEDKVYATDTHTLICMDNTLIDFTFENQYNDQKPTVMKGIVPPADCNVPLRIEHLLQKYMTGKVKKKIGEFVICEVCNGESTVEWEFTDNKHKTYTLDHNCPKCHGSGYESEPRYIDTDEKCIPSDTYFEINDVVLDARYLHRLYKVKELIGADDVFLQTWLESHKASPVRFTINDFVIIIMPTMASDQIVESITLADNIKA